MDCLWRNLSFRCIYLFLEMKFLGICTCFLRLSFMKDAFCLTPLRTVIGVNTLR